MLLIQWPPLLGLINLLEELTELREIFYLLDYCLIIKGYSSGIADRKDVSGKVWGNDVELHALSGPLCPHHPVFTNPITFWGLREASLHRHNWLNHWPLIFGHWPLIPPPIPPFSGNQGVGWKFQHFDLGCFPWQPAPILRWVSKVTSLT